MLSFSMDEGRFFADYYEKQPYIARGAASTVNVDWDEIDEALYRVDPRSNHVQLFQDGAISLNEFSEIYNEVGGPRSRFLKDVIYEKLRKGATLVVDRLHYYSPAINDICLEVAQFARARVVANGYAAFGGTGSFGKHWDTHSVFAVQLIGRKRWTVFEPTILQPLRGQTSRLHKHECPQDPVHDIVLERGDILYIPRGWWHEAAPIDGQETLHVAIGMYPPLVTDYLAWITTTILVQYVEGRRSLPIGRPAEHTVADLSQRLIEMITSPEVLAAFHRVVMASDRVNSRFRISMISDRFDKNHGDCADLKINASRHLSKLDTLPIINGLVIDADQEARNFLNEIGKDYSKDGSEEYIKTKNKLIHKLELMDVIQRRPVTCERVESIESQEHLGMKL